MQKAFTAVVKNTTSELFCGPQDWSTKSVEHNAKQFPCLEVITDESDEYMEMLEAAVPVYGESIRQNWGFATMSNYLAMRRFLSGPGEEMIWIEADMIRNEGVTLPNRYGVCKTKAFDTPGYTPTKYEWNKRTFCEAFIPNPRRPYSHMLSSWHRLKREAVERIVGGLNAVGLDFLTVGAWQLIRECELSIGVPKFRFYCDMVLELSWMASDWEADNVFDLLGWVSYHSDYETKPIIHFDGLNKPKIVDYLSGEPIV